MSEPLATLDDLEARLGRKLDAERAASLLVDASATVRAYAGQQFSAGTSTVRLKAHRGKVRLPQRPVVAVTAVDDVDGNTLSFTWDAGDSVIVAGSGGALNAFEIEPFRTGRPVWVDVTYDHGFDAVPDDIVAVVCQVAGRAYGTPSTEAGTTQETLGSYSYSTGSAAGAGPLGLLPDERAVLDRYRLVGGMATYGP
jgi:hypothetical protein